MADTVLNAVAAWVAAEGLPTIAARIPQAPAAELARLNVRSKDPSPPSRAYAREVRGTNMFQRSADTYSSGARADSPLPHELDALRPLVIERLLGALELTVDDLHPTGLPDLSTYQGRPPTGNYSTWHMDGQSQAVSAAQQLVALRSGLMDSLLSLTQQLARHPLIAPLLSVPPGTVGEAAIAAAHARGHLALSVATTTAVLSGLDLPGSFEYPAAVVGVSLGAALVLLASVPMPPEYDAAVLEKMRENYLYPRGSFGSVQALDHRFALLEGDDVPEELSFRVNGLVTVVPGGVVIRTGAGDERVNVILRILAEPPGPIEPEWDEVVDVSWHASTGAASVISLEGVGDAQLLRATPPWPGDYRVRVMARARDAADDSEHYELVVWAAPPEPEIVHRRTDRLGHRLRGEPEPNRVEPPEAAYRWMRKGRLSMAATVTVVTGSTVESVLRAFGADPQQPESSHAIANDLIGQGSIDPWVAVLDTGDAVVAVEDNGWTGSQEPVLRRASTAGRAASMFWNVNALTRLSFAENGELLAGFEPMDAFDGDPVLMDVLAGLNFVRDRAEQGMVAVERFTGYAVSPEDIARIEAADIGFRIVPDLPPLYPHQPPLPNGFLLGSVEPLSLSSGLEPPGLSSTRPCP